MNKPNQFTTLKSQILNDTEREGLDRLFTMMLTIRQQIQLREAFEDKGYTSKSTPQDSQKVRLKAKIERIVKL